MTAPQDRKTYVPTTFGSGEVLIDPWAPNALADDLAQSNPWAYAQALVDGPVPRMFANGTSDLPAFTASGIDPKLLLQVPAATRHALAAEPDIAVVQQKFEQDSTNPVAVYGHAGLDAAVSRLRSWAAGKVGNLDILNAQLSMQEEQRKRQDAINAAYARGGQALSDALIASYQAQDAEAAEQADRTYAAALDAAGIQRLPGSRGLLQG